MNKNIFIYTALLTLLTSACESTNDDIPNPLETQIEITKGNLSYCECMEWSIDNPKLIMKNEDVWDNCKWMEELAKDEEKFKNFHNEAIKDCPEIIEKIMSIPIEEIEEINNLSEEEIKELIKDK